MHDSNRSLLNELACYLLIAAAVHRFVLNLLIQGDERKDISWTASFSSGKKVEIKKLGDA
jgi:hypothetical protein